MSRRADPGELGLAATDGSSSPGQAVVFDIDGVLSDAVGRQHFIERGRRDWDAFFDACGDDPVIDELARLLELLDPELQIVLLTGRPMRVQPQTLAWLDRYGLRWDLLVMRARGDYSQVTWFKRDSVDELRALRLRPAPGLRGRPQQLRHVPRRWASPACTSTPATTSRRPRAPARVAPAAPADGQPPAGEPGPSAASDEHRACRPHRTYTVQPVRSAEGGGHDLAGPEHRARRAARPGG